MTLAQTSGGGWGYGGIGVSVRSRLRILGPCTDGAASVPRGSECIWAEAHGFSFGRMSRVTTARAIWAWSMPVSTYGHCMCVISQSSTAYEKTSDDCEAAAREG